MAKLVENTVIVGGAGKTGRRVGERLTRLALVGANAAYVTYFPDLALPGAADGVRRFTRMARDSGIEKLVLLAGRGEPQVAAAEQAVRDSGIAFTILECAFFNQNFSESLLAPVDGVIVFPAKNVGEPFLDCDDIADVAVAALTDDTHAGQTYELTGPEVLTFEQATATLAETLQQPLRYQPMSFEDYAGVLAPYLSASEVAFTIDLFRGLLDGHNASVTDGVERVLHRKPKDFLAFARGLPRAGD